MKVSVKFQWSLYLMLQRVYHKTWCFISSKKKKKGEREKEKKVCWINEQSLCRDMVNAVTAGIRNCECMICGTFQRLILSNVLTCKYCENILRADTVKCIEEPLWMLTLSNGVSNMVIWKQCYSNVCDIRIYIKDIVRRTRLKQSMVQIKYKVLSFGSLS